MSTGLLHLHSFIPYILLSLLLVVIVLGFVTLSSGKFSALQFKLARFAMIFSHIQLLVGLLVLFLGDAAQAAFTNGMGEVMKNPELRNRFVEHPTMMVLGVALITIGFSRAKRTDDDMKKNKSILLFFVLGLVLYLSKIPYVQWFNL